MSEIEELQTEEREALVSIYEGDGAFKQINPTTFQYKYGEDDNVKSFLVEIVWGNNYPKELPTINMDTFFNRNLVAQVKEKICAVLAEEAEQWLGCGMTYTLFECLKDRTEELLVEQPETPAPSSVDISSNVEALSIGDPNSNIKKGPKKEQLTKAQKRRQWERTDHKGERPRGWDWVDIVKHLSQTGGKDNSEPTVSSINPNSQPVAS